MQEGVVENMSIENDAIEILLDQHGKQFERQDLRITKLEETTTKLLISNGEINVKLSNIENGQLKIEKRLLENSNNQKELINKLIEKDSENQKNLWNLNWKTIGVITTCSVGLISLLTLLFEYIVK